MVSVEKIADDVNGVIKGDSDFVIKGVCDIELGKKHHLTYLKNSAYSKYLKTTKASVIITEKDIIDVSGNKILIVVDNAGFAFSKILNYIKKGEYSFNVCVEKNKISNSAIIDSTANIGKNVHIGKRTTIMSGVSIGDNTVVGDETIIYPNVVLYDNVKVGNFCKIDSGSVIGADGFGLVKNKNKNVSIPHIGKVIIGNDVYIGANCCIDRGTILDTVIEDNVRLDNFVQIAHNVKIGENCVIAGQVGIAGSTILENNVTVAGQSGIIDHLLIGKNSVIAAKSLVCNNLNPNSFVSGNPAYNHKDRLKSIARIRKNIK